MYIVSFYLVIRPPLLGLQMSLVLSLLLCVIFGSTSLTTADLGDYTTANTGRFRNPELSNFGVNGAILSCYVCRVGAETSLSSAVPAYQTPPIPEAILNWCPREHDRQALLLQDVRRIFNLTNGNTSYKQISTREIP